MKAIFYFCLFFLCVFSINAQILYSERFNTLTLQQHSSTSPAFNYTSVPSGMSLINDSRNAIIGNGSVNNPFNVASLQNKAWGVIHRVDQQDTFAVSTSWIDTTAAANRWLVTPVISNITNNTVLTWESLSPDPSYPDGYEVYVTTTTVTPIESDFTSIPANKLFSIQDGSFTGGGEQSSWQKHGVSLSAYAGQAVCLAFRNNSKNMYQLWLDDIVVENVSNAYDIALNTVSFYKYNTTASNNTVTCTIMNKGYTAVNSVVLNYTVPGLSTISQVFTPTTTIGYHESRMVTFTIPFSISNSGLFPVKAWVSAINNQSDQNALNDTASSNITIVTSSPSKNVLIESFTSTSCTWCPDSYTKLSALASSTVIPVSIHTGDQMTTISGYGLATDYNTDAPSALIDRAYWSDTKSIPTTSSTWLTKTQDRTNDVVPVSVSIVDKTYDTNTSELTFTVQATFTGEVKGDYRINAHIVENNVYGPINDLSDNGWNQLSGLYNVPWSPYYQQGSYLTTDAYVLNQYQFPHMFVVNETIDGVYGTPGVIPSNGGTQGQSYQTVYTYIMPTAVSNTFRYNIDNIYLVAYVSEYDTNDIAKRVVLNAIKEKVTTNSEITNLSSYTDTKLNVSVYPNPTTDKCTVSVLNNREPLKITVINTLGEHVLYVSSTNDKTDIDLSELKTGTYFIQVQTEKNSFIEKITLIK